MNVCCGGSFNPLHKGHEDLISEAIRLAGPKGHLLIGITSDTFIEKKDHVIPYSERKRALQEHLNSMQPKIHIELIKLDDPYGPATTKKDLDVILVTTETKTTAEKINDIRKNNGLTGLAIHVLPFTPAYDGRPLSSTRIRAGEITPDGTPAIQK